MAFRYFNGYQTGGRIENINEKIYLTIGDFNDWETPQLEDKYIGKIIEIDTINKSVKVVSRGHRNPQDFMFIQLRKNYLFQLSMDQKEEMK